MPNFAKASHFELVSLDHNDVLMNKDVHSTRNLLGAETSTTPLKLQLSFTLDGKVQTETLHRQRGAFKEGVTMTMGESREEIPVGEHYSYYSENKDWVLVFVGEERFEGLVFDDVNNKIHHFVGKEGELSVDSDVRSYFPGEMKKSRDLLSEANGIVYWDNCFDGQTNGLSSIDIGMAAGNVFYQKEQPNINALFNKFVTLANSVYERQMDVVLTIASVFIADTPQSFAPSSCTLDMSNQLRRFRDWSSRPEKLPLWHLIDDCFGAFGNTLGIAYISGACGSRTNVGVTQYFDKLYNEDQYQTWCTFTHEVGHNVAAQHSFEEGQGNTGGVMDYGTIRSKEINGETQFNTKYRKREVCAKFDSAARSGCLDLGVAPSPVGQFTQVLEPRTVEKVDRTLKCAKHSRRVPSSARTLTTLFGRTRLSCQQSCSEDADCAGYVTNGEGWCELVTSENVDTLNYSADFDTYLCTDKEELRESLKKLTADDILETLDTAELKSECCAATESQAYLGMNYFYTETFTKNACERRCVKDTQCEASTYDRETNGCLLYGGSEFTMKPIFDPASSALSCDRACLSAKAVTAQENATGGANPGAVGAAVIFAFAAMVSLTVAAVLYKRKTAKGAATPATVASAADAEIKQNTL